MYSLGYGAHHKQGSATYAQIGGPNGYLATLTPFAGNSMSACWEGEAYVVYSYNTAIAVVHPTCEGLLVEFNEHHYSVTTSRHQGQTKAWLGTNVKKSDLTDLTSAGLSAVHHEVGKGKSFTEALKHVHGGPAMLLT